MLINKTVSTFGGADYDIVAMCDNIDCIFDVSVVTTGWDIFGIFILLVFIFGVGVYVGKGLLD